MAYHLVVQETQKTVPIVAGGFSANTLCGFWQLAEESGLTAESSTPLLAGRDGTYTSGVSLNNYVSPDGKPAPQFFGGTTDYVDIFSAGLASGGGATDFDLQEGSISFWIKPLTADIWTDGNSNILVEFYKDASNHIDVRKNSTGEIKVIRYAGGSIDQVQTVVQTSDKWRLVTATWSESGNALTIAINDGTPASTAATGSAGGTITQAKIGRGATSGKTFIGSLAGVAVWSEVLSAATIEGLYKATIWRNAKYHYTSEFWLLSPDTVFAAQIDTWEDVTPGSDNFILRYIYPKNITTGALADIKEGMTILLGTTAGSDDKGRARVIDVVNVEGTDAIEVWASVGTHDGELTAAVNLFIEVLDDYRIWSKPPFADDGSYWFDGMRGPQGVTYEQVPIANMGSPVMDDIDSVTDVLTVDFDWSGAFAVADDAVLGGYSADLLDGTETVASSSNPGTLGNLTDGNTATYWESATNQQEWVKWYWPNYAQKHVRKVVITGHGVYSPSWFMIQWSDNNTDWFTAATLEEISWGSSEVRTFYLHDVDAHSYWRIYLVSNPYAATIRMREVEIYAEDRTVGSSPYLCDVGDGVIIAGSTTSEALTVEFPSGDRWIELLVTDTNGEVGFNHIPIVATVPEGAQARADSLGATITQSTGVGSRAFNDSHGTFWISDVGGIPAWLQIQYPSAQTVLEYDMDCFNLFGALPTDWIVKGSNDDIIYTTLDTQVSQSFSSPYLNTYTIATPGAYLYYRIEISGSTGTQVGINEFILTVEAEQIPGIIESFEIRNDTADAVGQVLDVAIFDDMPEGVYPDGTFFIRTEREVFDNVVGSLDNAGPAGRQQVKNWGWLSTEPVSISAVEHDLEKGTVIQCLDTGQRLRQVVGQTIMVQRDAAPATGLEGKRPNMDTFIEQIIRWVSTAAEISDFNWSNTTDRYNIGLIAAYGDSVGAMADGRAQAIAFRLTCNKHGQLQIKLDPLIAVPLFDGWIGTIETITPADYSNLDFTQQRPPRLHWGWGSGLAFRPLDADNGLFLASTAFWVSPGKAPGQGVGSFDQGEMLSSYYYDGSPYYLWLAVKWRTQQLYNRQNSPQSFFSIELIHAGDTGIDPAEMRWLPLTIDEDTKAQRGLTFTEAMGVPFRITRNHDAVAMTKDVFVEWERLSPLSAGAEQYTP